jgi:phage gp46-like protein
MAQFVNPCGPQPERCRSPIYPLFETGIAIKQVPLCQGPVCDCDTPSYGRIRLNAGGTLDRTKWLEGWVISQLSTRGEVGCEDTILRRREGGWWADDFRRGVNFKSGSKLWALQWSFVENDTLIMAEAYANEALAPLVSWGIASRIKVKASYVSRRVMRLTIEIIGPGLSAAVTIDGQALPNGGWAWGERQPEGVGSIAAIGPWR